MTIGVIASSLDTFYIWRVLHKYDHTYIVYYDDALWPYGDKSVELVEQAMLRAMQVLRDRGCQQLILPPVWELYFRTHKDVFPLFQRYVLEYCFSYSLIGKIGVMWDSCDAQLAQDQLTGLMKDYSLSDRQKFISTFHYPFKRWVKEVAMWKYFLMGLSYSHPMVHKIVKFDLRYFKDARVDTIIPLSYWYFAYQRTISSFLNFRKYRFHTLDALEKCFVSAASIIWSSDSYNVCILYTDSALLLQRQKRLIWLMQRGKQLDIVWEKVSV